MGRHARSDKVPCPCDQFSWKSDVEKKCSKVDIFQYKKLFVIIGTINMSQNFMLG